MISPDEFLRRCERAKAEQVAEGKERQQLTRELAALCALTGARAESVYDHKFELAGLRVFDPGGELVISGSVDEVLAELMGCRPEGPGRRRSQGPETMPDTAVHEAAGSGIVSRSDFPAGQRPVPGVIAQSVRARP